MRTDRRGSAWIGRGASLAAVFSLLLPAAAMFEACASEASTTSAGSVPSPPWLLILLGAAPTLVLAMFVLYLAVRVFRTGRTPAKAPERWTSALVSTPGSGIRQASGQSQGKRERQEDDLAHIDGDTLAADGNHSVALVADGMGGHAAGDVASRAAVLGFLQAYGTRGLARDRLRSALDRANAAIGEELDGDTALSGMGTTLVAAAVTEQGLHWISVGDSPLYLFRAGRLERLNEDHSMRPVIARLLEEDPDAASYYSPNQLLSALMGGHIEKTDAPATPRPLEAGDIVLVATDGLETLDEEETAGLIARHRAGGPKSVCDALLLAVEAKDHPRQDNTSLFVIEVERSSLNPGSAGPAAAAEPQGDGPVETPGGPPGDGTAKPAAEPLGNGRADKDQGGSDARDA